MRFIRLQQTPDIAEVNYVTLDQRFQIATHFCAQTADTCGNVWLPSIPAHSHCTDRRQGQYGPELPLGCETGMTEIVLDKVSFTYPGQAEPALHEVDLAIGASELVALLGAAGSGKSTLLRVLAGLERPDTGRVIVDGVDITGSTPADLNVAMVFQNYALHPNLTVLQNIELGLRTLPQRSHRSRQRATEVAHYLGLADHLRRRAVGLSPSVRMRVAFARSIVRDPQLLLLDEPVAHLESDLQEELASQLTELLVGTGITTILATGHRDEAWRMAHRIAVLHEGRIHQCGYPDELRETPASAHIGQIAADPPMSLIPGDIDPDGTRVRIGDWSWPIESPPVTTSAVNVGIWPDDLVVSEDGLPLEVRSVVPAPGEHSSVLTTVIGPRGRHYVTVLVEASYKIEPGQVIRVRPGTVHLFDAASGLRLVP